jgi:hypothetical protein
METKITNPQGTLTMSNDYVLPDRMHQTVSMSALLCGKMTDAIGAPTAGG